MIGYLRRNILGFNVHILLDPDLIERVLLDNAANYAKPDIVKSLLDPIIGRGLLTADAELWREQRRIVAATFSPAAVEAQRSMFVQAARSAMERWSDGDRLDMAAEATRTTMTVIALALFGGTAPLIATLLVKLTGWPGAPGLYLVLTALVCLVLVRFVPQATARA